MQLAICIQLKLCQELVKAFQLLNIRLHVVGMACPCSFSEHTSNFILHTTSQESDVLSDLKLTFSYFALGMQVLSLWILPEWSIYKYKSWSW